MSYMNLKADLQAPYILRNATYENVIETRKDLICHLIFKVTK